MADRYLLESGAPDGYLLEDGSGVYLLESLPVMVSNYQNVQAGNGISTSEKTGAFFSG